jgi:hypothetical protein
MLSCKRTAKYNELFHIDRLGDNQHLAAWNSQYPRKPATFDSLVNSAILDDIEIDAMRADACWKCFGYQIEDCERYTEIWDCIQTQQSHDIFLLERDRREIFLSLIMAEQFGYDSDHETAYHDFTVSPDKLDWYDHLVQMHIKHMPRSARLITWPYLPESHFDINLNTRKDQHSKDKLHHCRNLAQVTDWIDQLLAQHSVAWDLAIANTVYCDTI